MYGGKLNVKKLLTKIISSFAHVSGDVSIQSVTFGVGLDANSQTTGTEKFTPSSSDYSARCIVGWSGSSPYEGAGSSFILFHRLYLNQSNSTIYYGIRNVRSSAAESKITVYVLCTRKNSKI